MEEINGVRCILVVFWKMNRVVFSNWRFDRYIVGITELMFVDTL